MRASRLLVMVWLVGFSGCSATDDPIGSMRAAAWTPLAVEDDPLVRQPGTQPADGVQLEGTRCLNCHEGYNSQVEPGFNWRGSMMAQAGRDFMFWSAMTVTAQDSIWATGRPNATDICLRCHMATGWLEGRSDPSNGSAMTGNDFDGVWCDMCHRMYDPFFDTTADGSREGSDWAGYWDETGASATPSSTLAAATRQADAIEAQIATLFNGTAFFLADQPHSGSYTEAGSGQYFITRDTNAKRASFADANATHAIQYSRFHKSRYFCSTCHDVSNPVLANLSLDGTPPGDGTTVLPSESQSVSSYFHAERTFSEFILSDFGQQGGAPGIGPYAPGTFQTSTANNYIARCQDCHMRDVSGIGCNKSSGVLRPENSQEHPESGQPLHDMTGGNIWVSYVLASAIGGSPNYDATNAALLGAGPATLTLDLSAGLGIEPVSLLAGMERAKQQLQLAAALENLSYDGPSGSLSFRIQNHTGHKLITGFPEGRRMFVNVKAYDSDGALLQEINPYDPAAGTLKGLPGEYSPSSPALGANEIHDDELVYEVHPSSALTGEDETFHFALATGRHKDNRIPPKGFRIAQATARLAEPVIDGSSAPDHFTAAEYAGGYDDVSLDIVSGAAQVVISLYYQVTSREYIEFLRDEIKGPPNAITLPQDAYIIQSDPFFGQLKAWGDTIWQIWSHNKAVAGAAPFLMTQASVGGTVGCLAPTPSLFTAVSGDGRVTLDWSDEHSDDPAVTGYRVYYDQAGKAQLVTTVGTVTSYADTGLTNGQQYCYKVTSVYSDCESGYSAIRCATPYKPLGAICTDGGQCESTHCVDGVCCNSSCGGGEPGDCQACSVGAGATGDGSCQTFAAGRVCRPVAPGGCDVAETCDGVLTTCPQDGFAPDSVVCRSAASGGCDVAETCTGSSATCPGDEFAAPTVVCRPSAGDCDVAETCSGSSATCPTDGFAPDGQTCSIGTCQGGECVAVPVDASLPDDASVPDAATPDAATPDASVPDAATADAVAPDAATPDAAGQDAATLDGLAPDASITPDGAALDGPATDAPGADAGDAGTDALTLDAAPPDAFQPRYDGAPPIDAPRITPGDTTVVEDGDGGCSCNTTGGRLPLSLWLFIATLVLLRSRGRDRFTGSGGRS